MKTPKLSFAKQPRETGLCAIANPYPETSIKSDRKKVGRIAPPSRFGEDNWRIWLMEAKEPTVDEPAPFKWIKFKAVFTDEPSARAWLKARWGVLTMERKLHSND